MLECELQTTHVQLKVKKFNLQLMKNKTTLAAIIIEDTERNICNTVSHFKAISQNRNSNSAILNCPTTEYTFVVSVL